jgi:Na+-transporting NADH:ubiquinone oxidoreductase subunit F
LRRAYSVANCIDGNIIFIVKSLESGAGWSSELCSLPIDTSITVLWPLWHFLLSNEAASRLFIGTGTGFAPLYFQICHLLETGHKHPIKFIFWVRSEWDVFYLEELENLKNNYVNFDFSIYLSRQEVEWYESGYVTSYLASENITNFWEFYICGSPVMVSSVRAILHEYQIPKEKIFFEQF